MRRRIPYSRQSIDEQDIAAVADCLRSDFLTQGPKTPAFERAVADYAGAGHAVAVANGTAALHLVCQALGLGPGDRLGRILAIEARIRRHDPGLAGHVALARGDALLAIVGLAAGGVTLDVHDSLRT